MPIHDIDTTPISHVELRPMCNFGDSWTPVYIDQASYCNICWATAGVPAMYHRTFEELDEAVEYLLTDPKFADVPRWYDGNEITQQFACREDIVFALCDSTFYEDEELTAIGEKLGFNSKETEALIASYRARS